MITLKETKHSYYCSDQNYYHSESYAEFDTWEDFKNNWLKDDLELDDDLNHFFRFDIKKNDYGTFSLHLYAMLQRKGAFIPLLRKHIERKELPEINEFLEKRWQYLKKQWTEFSQ